MESGSSPELNTLQEENIRLRRAVEELSILNDLARVIGGTMNSQEIMQTIIHRSLRAVHAEQGVITLVDSSADRAMKTLVRSMVSSSDHSKFHLTESMLGWMHLNKKPLMVNDPATDERFRGITWDASFRNALSVPMTVKSTLIGVLTVYNKKEGKAFTDDEQRLLAIIATQSAQVVENARLYEKEKELVYIQEELRLAAQIQSELLPTTFPKIKGYQLSGKSIAAQSVGGDYFDFIQMNENKLAVCLGDVSGKGLPAAMLMANLQATLRGQTLLANSPKQCIERSNKLLHQSTGDEKYATLFYGILDTATHQFSYTNAGHNPPLIISKDGSIRLLRKGGIVVAMMETFPYDEETVSFLPGDTLIIYSDGISEAMNDKEEEFGEERLEALLKKTLHRPPDEMITSIINEVNKHAGNMPQMDDMTLVVLKMME
ncbi:SpoIIE family protein phosphatase [bacterium]|nr:SpoIIE family protein phosphatase [bacterium]